MNQFFEAENDGALPSTADAQTPVERIEELNTSYREYAELVERRANERIAKLYGFTPRKEVKG